MSPDAVAARLSDLASLYELGVSLRTARVIGPVTGGDKPRPYDGEAKNIPR